MALLPRQGAVSSLRCGPHQPLDPSSADLRPGATADRAGPLPTRAPGAELAGRALKNSRDTLAAIADRMAALKRAGLIYAAEHWREGRYLYLIFPMKDGQRPKPAYVGCDPARIAEAQAALARAVEFDALAEQQRRLEWLADSVARQLRSTLAELDVLRHFERAKVQELADLER